MSKRPRLAVWGDADQIGLIEQAIKAAPVELAALGSPEAGAATHLAKTLAAPRVADLRELLQDGSLDFVWLASREPLDASTRKLLNSDQRRVVCCEPPIGTLADISDSSDWDHRVDLVPRMRRTPGFRTVAATLEQFGQVLCINVFFRCGPGQGSLYARLFDAMDTMLALCGPAQAVNAALAGPRPEAPQTLAALHGHLTINVRFKSNRCACLALSDRAGAWFRGVTVLGEGGCLRISDAGMDWIGSNGEVLERQSGPSDMTAGELIGMQMKRSIEGLDAADPPADVRSTMALCEAARLSCVTGQDEAPAKLAEVLARP